KRSAIRDYSPRSPIRFASEGYPHPTSRISLSFIRLQELPPRSLHLCDDGEALDALIAVGIQERIVISKRDAAVGITVRTEHVGVGKQSAASENRVLAADGSHP